MTLRQAHRARRHKGKAVNGLGPLLDQPGNCKPANSFTKNKKGVSLCQLTPCI